MPLPTNKDLQALIEADMDMAFEFDLDFEAALMAARRSRSVPQPKIGWTPSKPTPQTVDSV